MDKALVAEANQYLDRAVRLFHKARSKGLTDDQFSTVMFEELVQELGQVTPNPKALAMFVVIAARRLSEV